MVLVFWAFIFSFFEKACNGVFPFLPVLIPYFFNPKTLDGKTRFPYDFPKFFGIS